MSVHCVLIQAFFIAVRFVRAVDQKWPSVLVVRKCLVDIKAADMVIQVIQAEGIGRAVVVIYKVLNVLQRIRSEHNIILRM